MWKSVSTCRNTTFSCNTNKWTPRYYASQPLKGITRKSAVTRESDMFLLCNIHRYACVHASQRTYHTVQKLAEKNNYRHTYVTLFTDAWWKTVHEHLSKYCSWHSVSIHQNFPHQNFVLYDIQSVLHTSSHICSLSLNQVSS